MRSVKEVSEENKTKNGMSRDRADVAQTGYAQPVFGNFPGMKWKEYEKSVKEEWGDTRWVKAWHDHKLSKQNSDNEALWSAVLELKMRLNRLEGEDKKDDKVKVLGTKKESVKE